MKYLILLLFASSIIFSQNFEAKIDVDDSSDDILIKGIFYNHSDFTINFSYEMISLKKGESGTSSTKQKGNFTAEPDEKVLLSEVFLNKDCSNYKIKLLIFDDIDVVTSDSVKLNFKNEGAN